jgi:hypothetical protein
MAARGAQTLYARSDTARVRLIGAGDTQAHSAPDSSPIGIARAGDVRLLGFLPGLPGNGKRGVLATPAGLEPATCRLEGGCSIQLSYGAESKGPIRPM